MSPNKRSRVTKRRNFARKVHQAIRLRNALRVRFAKIEVPFPSARALSAAAYEVVSEHIDLRDALIGWQMKADLMNPDRLVLVPPDRFCIKFEVEI